MLDRGKFHTLTMVNWNGFFARSFDLDDMVTTLSGGNGAGKSTVMASFITALIPDQTLLHFRNTTEAGSSSSSRDKGLHGKLKAGTCYSAIEVVNSRAQRLIYAVKLQQIAGRDKKVDIKPIIIKGLPIYIKAADLFVQAQENGSAKVRTINELKEYVQSIAGVQYMTPTSVTDYHADMFEYGVLPKRLRTQGDRGKFYRLIEASLYGGISSTITKSLREYLLPQNAGVKKAFQDMESALRENRMTLEAIGITQRDRNLFKHLISQTTDYVAADFVRNANQRKDQLTQAVSLRRGIQEAQNFLAQEQQQLDVVNEELEILQEDETNFEIDFQSASDHLQLAQSAMRQQEKIERYQEDLLELTEKLEEQQMLVEEMDEQNIEAQGQLEYFEEEADSLKSQLADYQQALDVQQTRVLQYQQATQALDKARDLSQNSELNVEDAQQLASELEIEQAQLTESLLSLKHKFDMAQAAQAQFDQALALVHEISGDNVTSAEAVDIAKGLLAQAEEHKALVSEYDLLVSQYQNLHNEQRNYEQAQALVSQYQGLFSNALDNEEDIESARISHQETLDDLDYKRQDISDELRELTEKSQRLGEQVKGFEKQIPEWITANDALDKLIEQTESVSIEASFLDSQSLISAMQQVLDAERDAVGKRDATSTRCDEVDAEIECLAQPGGIQDPRITEIAYKLGGVVLSEIYDDININDAPYYSALYGPASQSIVVNSFDDIAEKLNKIEDCPQDLYLIQGNPSVFVDACEATHEFEQALCVQVSERQMRFTQYPQVPVFGSAAREERLEQLYTEKETLNSTLANLSFDAQKLARLYQRYTNFMAEHIRVAFENDPELERDELQERIDILQAQTSEKQTQLQQIESQVDKAQQGIQLLNRIQPMAMLLGESHIEEKVAELQQRLSGMQLAKDFMAKFGTKLEKLAEIQTALYADPEQSNALKEELNEKDQQLQESKRLAFALADLIERRHHFSYQDALELVEESSEFKEQLKQKLINIEAQRNQQRTKVQQLQAQRGQDQQILASLKSAQQAKQDTLEEFQHELSELGIHFEPLAVENAEQRKEQLHEQLATVRQHRSEQEKAQTTCELKIKDLLKEMKQGSEAYKALRIIVVQVKRSLAKVFSLVRYAQLEKRLYKRELTLLKPDQLRSMSDKALGALRQAVADNETLRDALRASEEAGKPEKKVQFYLVVYQHLKERIRQDIIQTDDPVEAIEEMEVELARLTHELTQREQRLAISSDSVASVIRKTIQREQNRIRLLNQGLQQIGFGQVKGVRLAVSIRETHLTLLDSLVAKESQHQDLFTDINLSLSEAMAKLYQRLNPQIDVGQRSAQTLGDELLDYRNYLELSIEVNRGSDGWLRAESGALSTGEAIGTGQAILLMVMQSWEEESRRLRSKDILPCRLLFLDEAARLDTKSIATLFELCGRLHMQLLIAAPENISPENGTTYKLIRKISGNKEQVHVVGLKGFAQ